MKCLQLTRGKVAILDDDMHDLLSQWKWNASRGSSVFYAVRTTTITKNKRVNVMMHHAVIGRPLNGFQVDHINGNGLDNRRENLRIVSVSENQRNKKCHRDGKPLGVTFHKQSGKWMAQIGSGTKRTRKYLGTYPTIEQAAKVVANALFHASPVEL